MNETTMQQLQFITLTSLRGTKQSRDNKGLFIVQASPTLLNVSGDSTVHQRITIELFLHNVGFTQSEQRILSNNVFVSSLSSCSLCETKMLNRKMNVQECDATMLHNSNPAKCKKEIQKTQNLNFKQQKFKTQSS